VQDSKVRTSLVGAAYAEEKRYAGRNQFHERAILLHVQRAGIWPQQKGMGRCELE
jgi:hypothetical protein